VLSEILGSNTTSRLYRSLAVERKLATYAGSSYQPLSIDWSNFYLYAAPLPGVSLQELEAAVDGAVAELVKSGVSEEELREAVARMKARTTYALDDPQAIATIFGSVLSVGLSIEDIQSWPDRLDRLTVDAVNAAAQAVLRPERSVTGELVPAPKEG
jgi:zinc protease